MLNYRYSKIPYHEGETTMSIVSSLIKRVLYPESYSGEAYINTLKHKYRIDIGDDCVIWSPNQTYIDKTRPHMLHIGNRVKITRNVTILCHDYSRSVWCDMPGAYENIGEAALTHIGDNVFIGVNATILMGAHIGNNSIIGAGAVVSGKYPNNSVIAGNPAKVICTIDELYTKRKKTEVEAAKIYAKEWKRTNGVPPTVFDMTNAFAWLYLPHTQESMQKYAKLFKLKGVDEDVFIAKFLSTQPLYNSFEAFLKDCEIL